MVAEPDPGYSEKWLSSDKYGFALKTPLPSTFKVPYLDAVNTHTPGSSRLCLSPKSSPQHPFHLSLIRTCLPDTASVGATSALEESLPAPL